ncbi:clostripain-related cysteine peptidase [[Eubacterium] cellulosolvens]
MVRIRGMNLKRLLKSHKLLTLLIIVIVITIVIGTNIPTNLIGKSLERDDDTRSQALWTCLFYFDGDNNLADFNEMLTNLELLQKVGSTDKVHMVCLLDRNGPDDSRVLYIKKGSMDEITLSEVNPEWTSEVNMGDPDTLTAMAEWTFDTYPADHQIILLSNHGGGWRGVCWDDSSDGDNLDLEDLKTSMAEITNHLGRKLDILATEACLVGMIEFAYAIQDYAELFIGSQAFSFGAENTTEGGFIVGNWQYDLMWSRLIEAPGMTPKEFCQVIIENFKQYGPWRAPPGIPKTESSDTLSVIDTALVGNVVAATNEFSEALKSVFPIRRQRVRDALQITEQFSGQLDFIGIASFTNIDLWDFADKISSITALNDVRNSAARVKQTVTDAVVLETHGTDPMEGDHVNAHGMSIYMPQRSTEYNEKYDTIDFAKDTQWDEFIKAYWLMPS